MNYNFPSEFDKQSDKSIGFSFIKVYNLWHKKIKKALSNVGLTHPQFIVLTSLSFLLNNQTEVNQVDIANATNIDVMTISTIIKNLEKKGLVIRRISHIDTRAKLITLTESGNSLVEISVPIVENIDKNFFGSLDNQTSNFNKLLLSLIRKNLI